MLTNKADNNDDNTPAGDIEMSKIKVNKQSSVVREASERLLPRASVAASCFILGGFPAGQYEPK